MTSLTFKHRPSGHVVRLEFSLPERYVRRKHRKQIASYFGYRFKDLDFATTCQPDEVIKCFISPGKNAYGFYIPPKDPPTT